mmetsp:Transcript_35437/g.60733  ORF Transcript_35437/g.60733 Transcript_35437/m.60733 type:complete len:206 (+) Transcript_35437:255-872(+)
MQPADSRVGACVFGFSPCSVGFLHSLRWSKSPRYASVKSVFVMSASSNDVPESTALLKVAPLKDAPLKYARSITPLVKSVPSKLAPGAYTLDSWVSLKLALLKTPLAMSAPERSKLEASDLSIWHSRRSYRESRAAFAWPIAEPTNLHRSFLERSMGGNLNVPVSPSASAGGTVASCSVRSELSAKATAEPADTPRTPIAGCAGG